MHRGTFVIIGIIVLTISLAGNSAFAASNPNIEGHVWDAQTKNPLPGANVMLKGTSLGASTDLDGRYVIHNVPPGRYIVRAAYIGYRNKEVSINVKQGLDVKLDFMLKAVGVQGKEVVVTGQASGQNQAINQELSSMQIENVVSAARIQELPDANAAESVARLPGVSLIRQGGEGSEIVIRGLAPQYNQLTIDGVQVPANDVGDRGVNLSMISSNMLGGIEVTKAITPDMNAAVLGGTVNFDLREAQGTVPSYHFLVQDEYNNLENSYNDYKFVGSGENRFWNKRLGVFAEVEAEKRNLSSNELGASYYLNAPKLGVSNPVYLTGLNLADILRDRKRYGATVVIDYRSSTTKIGFMNFISTSNSNTQNRGETYGLSGDSHSYTTTDGLNKLNVITDLLDVSKSFPLFSVDAKVSHSYSENRDPNDLSFEFSQASAGISNDERSNPQSIPGLSQNNLRKTYLVSVVNSNHFSRDRQISASVDFTSNVNFSKTVTSVLKFGGEYQYTIRSYDYNQGDGDLAFAGSNPIRAAIISAYPWMMQSPYNLNPSGSNYLPITVFEDPNFRYGKILGGDYTMVVPVNVGMMWQTVGLMKKYGTLGETWGYNSLASITHDYHGNEYETAGYGMVTLNLGPDITFLPGVRYQVLHTSYTAPRGIETSYSRYEYAYHDTTLGETHGFWLPMVHLRYNPLSWLQVHLAYTNTLNYPNYTAIVPRIDVGISSVAWDNYALTPAHSANYDAIISVYNNSIGLFSVDGFYKYITNLIFSAHRIIIDQARYPGLPPNINTSYPINTYINNPFPVKLWGTELEWETHFWYLPGPLSGLVLSVNYTHIFSGAQYPLTTITTTYTPKYTKTVLDTFYTDRMIDQPNDIANLTIGYDYRGFGMRVSMLYQANVFQGENFWPELRVNSGKYVRWDVSAKQSLPWFGLQAFFDLNNLNDAADIQQNEGSGFPAAEQYYGMSADLGLRWIL